MSARHAPRPGLTPAKLRRLIASVDAVRECVDLGTVDRRRLADAGLIAAAYLDRMNERTAATAARIEQRAGGRA